ARVTPDARSRELLDRDRRPATRACRRVLRAVVGGPGRPGARRPSRGVDAIATGARSSWQARKRDERADRPESNGSAERERDGGIPRTSDWYASRARRRSLIAAAIAIALAGAYAAAIVATEGDGRLVIPVVAILVVFAVLANPAVGIYLLFAAGILFEQFPITGLT